MQRISSSVLDRVYGYVNAPEHSPLPFTSYTNTPPYVSLIVESEPKNCSENKCARTPSLPDTDNQALGHTDTHTDEPKTHTHNPPKTH